MHDDQIDAGLYNVQTDADLQMLICIMIILWYLNLYVGTFRVGIKVEIKVRIKIIQYVCIHNLFHYTPPFLLGLTIDWKIEDSDAS